MHVVQIFSAVYLLLIFAYTSLVALRYLVTGRAAELNIEGVPALIGCAAIIVCAVTVLAEVG